MVQPLDIEKPFDGDEPRPGMFDVILAANVVHATADIRATLSNAAQGSFRRHAAPDELVSRETGSTSCSGLRWMVAL